MKLDACRKKVDLRVIYAGLCSDGKTLVKAPLVRKSSDVALLP